MSTLELIQLNLFSPAILCFGLGIVATLVRSDLKFPEPLYQGLSIFLLFAIGLKGGVALSSSNSDGMWVVLLSAVVLTACMPLWCFPALRYFLRLSRADAAAVAAHYASVSVVTYIASIAFLDAMRQPYEGFLPAMVALMEVPGIVVALLLVQRMGKDQAASGWLGSVRTVLVGKSVFLLLGGLAVGAVSGSSGMAKVEGFFVVPFQGVLCLFLLEMGMVASRRFGDLKKVGAPLLIFAVVMPVFHASLGICIGYVLGLSKGGTFVLGTLAASASYIAAPATVRLAIPEANPAFYLTSALAVTFPFNLTLGIPLYFAMTSAFFP